MSFNNTGDLERVASNKSHRYRDYPEFESISSSIDKQLHVISSSQLKEIRELLASFKRNDQDLEISHKLQALFNSTTEDFKKLNDSIKSLNNYIKSLTSQHEDIELINYLKQKENLQINLIKDSLNNFKRYQSEYETLLPSLQPELLDSSHAGLLLSEQQLQLQQQIQITYEPLNAEELEQQTITIQQREQEIQKINQDTQEINEIFQNLSNIIQEQQFSIDNIENNIFSYGTDARGASNELRSAERYQRRSGGRMLCCLFILLGILAFIIMIMVIF